MYICVLLFTSCQREKLNELSVDFNQSLIIPPTYDLPDPGTKKKEEPSKVNEMLLGKGDKIETSNDQIIKDILKKTNPENSNDSIRDTIDYETGYKNDESFFNWLIKGKSERDKLSKANKVIDPFEEKID